MPRRPATILQADVARAIRAAKQEGWHVVRVVTPTGATIEIGDTPDIHSQPASEAELEPLDVI